MEIARDIGKAAPRPLPLGIGIRPAAPTPRPADPGLLESLYWLKRNPLELITEEMFRNPVTERRLLGQRAVFLNSPSAISAAFAQEGTCLAIDPIRKRLLAPLFETGLAAVEGEVWKESRRSAQAYFSQAHLSAYAGIFQSTAAEYCERYGRRGAEVDLLALTGQMTFSAVARCLFGVSAPDDPRPGVRLFDQALDQQMSMDPADASNMPRSVPRLSKLRAWLSLRRSRRVLDHITNRRLAHEAAGLTFDDLLDGYFATLENRQDPSPEERKFLRENFGTMLGAGFETTALLLCWGLGFLAQSPEQLARATHEARHGQEPESPTDWARARPYLTALVYETMRIFPIIPALARIATAEFEVEGTTIRKDDFVISNFWVVNRNEANWPEAGRFQPERFLDQPLSAFRAQGYFPYGLGPRSCIGARFGLLNAVITLSEVLRRFDISLTNPGALHPTWRGTVRPGGRVRLRLTPAG